MDSAFDGDESQSRIEKPGRQGGEFQAIKDPVVRWALRLLPWAILVVLAVEFEAADLISRNLRASPAGIVMYSSGMVAVALALLACQVLMQRIPDALRTLWARGVIGEKSIQPSASGGGRQRARDGTLQHEPTTPPEKQYEAFLQDVESSLNHPYQWLMGLFFFLLVFTWASRFPLTGYSSFIGIAALAGLAIEFPTALVVGLMAWRMVVVGVQVWRLGRTFRILPEPAHPDACGGLEPLGSLCLWNALIVSVAGLYLGGWTILGPSTPYSHLAASYAPLFSKLLLVPVGIAAVGFFLPLWSLHQVMVSQREEVQRRLDQLAQVIDDLQRELLDRAKGLEPEESEKMIKKLQLMQQVYRQSQNPPTWPFNVRTLAKLASAQAIPLLGVTGLGDPVVRLLKALLDSLAEA